MAKFYSVLSTQSSALSSWGGHAMTRHIGWSRLVRLLVVLGLVGSVAAQQPKPGGTLRAGGGGGLRQLCAARTRRAPGERPAHPGVQRDGDPAHRDVLQSAESTLPGCAGAAGHAGIWDRPARHRQDGAIGDGAAALELRATSVSSFAFLQAARSYVQGYENLHGYKLRFERTWLDK